MIKKITSHALLSLIVAFAVASCSCNNYSSKATIKTINKKESVIPKIKTTNKNLKKVVEGNVLGGEKILQLQIRTTNALFLAQKQKAQDLEAKLVEIGKELDQLKLWNKDQASSLQVLEGNLRDVEIALSLKEDEADQLRAQNEDLKKRNAAAHKAVSKAQEEVLKVKAECDAKLVEAEKKIDALKKYRNICLAVGGLLAAGILFKLFGPRFF